ncbi:transposase, partial [Kurthia gibsonii]
IPEEAFAPFYKATGCPSYHPKMMLKIILCGYTQSIFSGRRMEDLTKDSVRMMWLAQGYEPSYRTINRFRIHPQMQELLKQCFIQFRCRLIEEKCIDQQAIFIDGTKIEANANKFTFVWKKSVENYQASMIEKSNALYEQLVEERILPAIQKEQDDALSSEELEQVASTLEEVIDDYTEKLEASSDSTERKQLRAARKTPKQYLKQVKDWIVRKRQYRLHLQQMGTRNSYSKTDVDATFMR